MLSADSRRLSRPLRARLFLKDTAASRDMFYDEDAQKRTRSAVQVLNVPVTDFELSVRSRNCLQKMGIRTLGDLTRTTEQELLASKNFGETSLARDPRDAGRQRLAARAVCPRANRGRAGLRPDDHVARRAGSAGASDLRPEPLGACPQVHDPLGLTTIGELIRKTGDDLLECKNFGVTSLNEVRES